MLTNRPGCQKVCNLLMLLFISFLLTGCNTVLFDSKGAIGHEQGKLIILAFVLMLIVVLPAMAMTFIFAWRYREGNKSAKYSPDWAHSNKIELVVWGVPIIIILILGTVTYLSTVELNPRKPLASTAKPITIEAISLDWKWLFVYPELNIATVNQIAFPVNVPVEFKVTSYSVMNSFFIPQLGSQIYAMAGMRNQVNLIANEEGTYKGISANYSGSGFSDMKFTAEATSQEGFEQWVAKVRQSSSTLPDMEAFKELAKPDGNHPVTYFSTVSPTLFDDIINIFMEPEHSSSMTHSTTAIHSTNPLSATNALNPVGKE